MAFDIGALKNLISGKKTYIVVVVAFISLVVAWSNGKITNEKMITDTVAIALALTIRMGVAKTNGAPVDPETPIIPSDVQEDIDNAILNAAKKVTAKRQMRSRRV